MAVIKSLEGSSSKSLWELRPYLNEICSIDCTTVYSSSKALVGISLRNAEDFEKSQNLPKLPMAGDRQLQNL